MGIRRVAKRDPTMWGFILNGYTFSSPSIWTSSHRVAERALNRTTVVLLFLGILGEDTVFVFFLAVGVAVDSKVQYVAVCNAAETLLVHKDVAAEYLPRLKAELDKHNVEIRGCEASAAIIDVTPATEEDWRTEYLDYILAVRVVNNWSEATIHINDYGSGHTDTIVTENEETAVKRIAEEEFGCEMRVLGRAGWFECHEKR